MIIENTALWLARSLALSRYYPCVVIITARFFYVSELEID